jgi:sterol desaturase/sphingolipid hydroxylase (fatty acid hydroxylase superfamily)
VLLGFVLAQIVAFILEMLVNAVGHDPVKGGAIDRKVIAWLALASYHAQHHANAGKPHEGDPGRIVIKLLEQ